MRKQKGQFVTKLEYRRQQKRFQHQIMQLQKEIMKLRNKINGGDVTQEEYDPEYIYPE